jgi:hypothetical protein
MSYVVLQISWILNRNTVQCTVSGEKQLNNHMVETLCKQFANILDIEPKTSGE